MANPEHVAIVRQGAAAIREWRAENDELFDLRNANLEGVNLCRANLSLANFEGANLEGAYLERADLYLANFEGANLEGANLERANLYDATLSNIIVSWQSHQLLSEILFRAATTNDQKMLAGWIRIDFDICWKDWLEIEHPAKRWALEELSRWVKDGDDAPEALKQIKESRLCTSK